MDGSLLRSKYERFQQRHAALLEQSDPRRARESFPRTVARCRRVSRMKLGCYALIYLGTISSLVLAVLRFTALLGEISDAIRFFSAAAPALAVFGLLGALACTRVLAFLEVDLLYLSLQASRPGASPGKGAGTRRTGARTASRAR